MNDNNNQFNQMGQNNVNPGYQQPMGQPVQQNNFNQGYQQPMGQPQVMIQKNNTNNTRNIILGVIGFVVGFVVVYFILSGAGGKSQLGEWDCGTIQLKIEKNTVTLSYGDILSVTEKYSTPRGKANEKHKKSGFTYKNYEMKNVNVSGRTMDLGFSFGVSKDGTEGHYIDGLNQSIPQKYDCKKK